MDMNDQKTKISYALGINMAESLSHLPLEVDPAVVQEGIKDYFAGNPKLDPAAYRATMEEFQKTMQEKARDAMEKISKENIAAEQEFLSANAQKSSVITTASGLQYTVISEGSGKKPTSTDKVRVHYTGTLLNGQIFDSSLKRGVPAEFGVNQVIPGWTEALQLMSVGSKYKLFIPARLAYGERGAGNAIPPHAMLTFEVELLAIL